MELKEKKNNEPHSFNASTGSGYGIDTICNPHGTLGSEHDHTSIAAGSKRI